MVEKEELAEILNIENLESNKEGTKETNMENLKEESENFKETVTIKNQDTEKTVIKEENNNNYDVMKNKNKTKLIIIISTIIILTLALLSTGFALLNIKNTNIIHGVTIRNINIQGLSKEQAIKVIDEILKNETEKEIEITVSEVSNTISPGLIETKYKIQEAVDKAYNIGRNGNIFANNFEIAKAMLTGTNIDLELEYNEEKLDNFLKEIKANIPGKVVESEYSIEEDNLIIKKGRSGLSIDEEKVKSLILEEIKNGTYNPVVLEAIQKETDKIDIDKIHEEVYTEAKDAYYTTSPYQVFPHVDGVDFNIEEAKKILEEDKDEYIIKLTITKPKITTDQIGTEAFPDLLSSFTTTYDESNVSRSTNVKLAAKKINKVIVPAGEIFSYNRTVGERTAAAGYRNAAGYEAGKVVQMLGGGICQVSSTLYDAVVYANLGITERHNHMFKTSYIEAGRDATVVYGSLDFKFKNTREYPIMIKASAQSGVLRIEIYGVKEKTEYEVDILVSRLSTIPFKTIYENDPSVESGYETVTQNGMNGCKTITYKVLKLNGTEVSRSVLSQDTYSAMNKYVTRGTKIVKPTPTPIPNPKPNTSTDSKPDIPTEPEIPTESETPTGPEQEANNITNENTTIEE